MISALRVLSSCGKWRRWWAEWLDGYHESTLSNFFLWTYFPCDFVHILKCNVLNWTCVGFKKPILPYLKAALANKQQLRLYSVFLTKTRCAYVSLVYIHKDEWDRGYCYRSDLQQVCLCLCVCHVKLFLCWVFFSLFVLCAYWIDPNHVDMHID